MPLRRILAAAFAASVLGPACEIAGATNLYVTNHTGASVSAFSTAADGVPAPISCDPATACHTGDSPNGVAIDPSGRHLYVANSSDGTVSVFAIEAGGALSPIPCGATAVCDAGSSPSAIAIAPDGRRLYVSNYGGGVLPFAIAADGSLAPLACGTCGTGGHAFAMSMTPDGRHLYVTLADLAGIAAFTVAADGSLSPIDCAPPQSLCATGGSPYGMVIDPAGRYLYASSDGGPSHISAFAIDPDGSLTTVNCGTSCNVDHTVGLAIDPSGAHLYASIYTSYPDPGGIVPFAIAADGKLVPIACNFSGACGVQGSNVDAIAIDPAGRHLYVTSYTASKVFPFALGPTGAPAPLACDPPGACATGSGPDYFGIVARPDQGPTAAFTTVPGTAGSATTFDAGGSTDSDGQVTRYDWDFGDGQTASATSAQAAHTYASPGAYTVTLTVTDDIGCSTTVVFTGQTASCNGTTAGRATSTVQVPPAGRPSGPAAPVVSGFAQGRSRWRLGSALAKISRAKVGTTFSFSVDQAGSARLAFARLSSGRRVGGRCVKPTSANRRKPGCARARPAGTLTRAVVAGPRKLRFAGRLSPTKRLTRGRHRVTLTVTNAAGLRSAPKRLTFTIVR